MKKKMLLIILYMDELTQDDKIMIRDKLNVDRNIVIQFSYRQFNDLEYIDSLLNSPSLDVSRVILASKTYVDKKTINSIRNLRPRTEMHIMYI